MTQKTATSGFKQFLIRISEQANSTGRATLKYLRRLAWKIVCAYASSGTKGSLEWMQEFPQALTFKPLHAPSQNRTPNGPGTLPLAARSSRIVAGHPEGFHEGFANIYSDAAEAISARRAGKEANPLALYFPNSHDGLLVVRFVNSVIESSKANGKWTKC